MMKKTFKIIRNIVILLYAIIAIFVTICLLSYNEYKITEFGQYSLVIANNSALYEHYNEGDLIIVNRQAPIEKGDKVFFYNTFDRTMEVSIAKVTNIEEVTASQRTFTFEGDKKISSDYVIGLSGDNTTFATVGTILAVLQSQWGFLLLVVLPALLAFLYEIFEIFSEMKGKNRRTNGEKSS